MDSQEKFGTSMAGGSAETAMERGTEVYEKAQQYGAEAYQKTSEAVGEAYEKTATAVGGAYDQAVSYGRENPAVMTLIAFGLGVGVGLLLASSVSRSRSRSFAEPIVDAISDFANDYLK
jgi:ElaB/YqjD/DUF883 family membrane-anchored ribosome-binding protein